MRFLTLFKTTKKPVFGIICVLVAVFLFSLTNAAVKKVASQYPMVEVLFFRFIFALVGISAFLGFTKGPSAFRTKQLYNHLIRAGTGYVALFASYLSFTYLPFSDAIAISFTEVLFMTLFSSFIIGEKVDYKRWLAIFTGFCGVILASNPHGIFNIGVFLALTYGIFDAYSAVLGKKLCIEENALLAIFYYSLLSTFFCLPFLFFLWKTPSFKDLVLLCLMGIAAGVALFIMTYGFYYSKVSTAASMTYSAMIWAILWGFLFWGEVPTFYLLGGVLAIIGSGLYVIKAEQL